VPEIEDIKPTSILWKNKLLDRTSNPFVPVIPFSDALTFQNVEDTMAFSIALALADNFTNATNTFQDTNLSFNVVVGTYAFECLFQVANTTSSEGMQTDFGGGTCVIASSFVEYTYFDTDAQLVGAFAVNSTLAAITNYSPVVFRLSGSLTISSPGTLIVRAAEYNTHSTGTMTLLAGSWMNLTLMSTV
jgi:hypothetical protein